jgi:hypothetical protein
MPLQQNIFGEEVYVGNVTEEVSRVLSIYPAAATDTAHFLWLILRNRCPWVAQLPEPRQMELQYMLRDVENLRRRKQEWRGNHEK